MIEIYGRKYVHFGLKRLYSFFLLQIVAFLEAFMVSICSKVR